MFLRTVSLSYFRKNLCLKVNNKYFSFRSVDMKERGTENKNIFMEIPRVPWDSNEVSNFIKNGEPCVLLNCPLAMPNSGRWTPDYLSEIILPDFLCDIFVSQSKLFYYWDDGKNKGYKYTPPTVKQRMYFSHFLKLLRKNPTNGPYFYLQQSAVAEMGSRMMDEYSRFSLETALKFKLLGGWDAFSTNLLIVGSPGVITPAHFDEQQNLFAQLSGLKRVRLFPPAAWRRLYTFPYSHACDRQAQVPLPEVPGSTVLEKESDRERFPAFSEVDEETQEYYVDLTAGEILFIPQYWYHQMESLTENTSLSWWFKHQGKFKPDEPIDVRKTPRIVIRRNLEKLILSSFPSPLEAHNFFVATAGGRVLLPDGSALIVAPIAADVTAAASIVVDPRWSMILESALQMAKLVLPPDECPRFLTELVSGRFSSLQILS